jgi:hypothetical protein
MANEVRLIDANALLQKLHRMIDYCKADNKVTGLTALFQVGDAIMDCKTVDAVEVVRCKDCKHIESVEGGVPYCAWHCSGCGENDFRSYGERKGNG